MAVPKSKKKKTKRKSKYGPPASTAAGSQASNDTLGSSDEEYFDNNTTSTNADRNDLIATAVAEEMDANFASSDSAFNVILRQLSIESRLIGGSNSDRLNLHTSNDDNDENANFAEGSTSGNTVLPDDAASESCIDVYSDGEPVSFHLSESSSNNSLGMVEVDEASGVAVDYEETYSASSLPESPCQSPINASAEGCSNKLTNSSFSGTSDLDKRSEVDRNSNRNNVSASGCTNTCTNSSNRGMIIGNPQLGSNGNVSSSNGRINNANSNIDINSSGCNLREVSTRGSNTSCTNSRRPMSDRNTLRTNTKGSNTGVVPPLGSKSKRKSMQEYRKQMRDDLLAKQSNSSSPIVIDISESSPNVQGKDLTLTTKDKDTTTQSPNSRSNKKTRAKHKSKNVKATTTNNLIAIDESDDVTGDEAVRAKFKHMSGSRPSRWYRPRYIH